jgi:hypothetical protein
MPIKWLRVSIFAVHVIILYSVWGVIMYRQNKDIYLQIHLKGSCQSFQVTFDEEKTKTFSDAAWFGVYGGFSDFYEISREKDGTFAEWEGDRPVYYQRNFKDGFGANKDSPGKFSYCKTEEAWVFTIDGFAFNNKTDSTAKDDKHSSWLLRSPKTKAYTLVDTPRTGWSIWLNLELVSADALFTFSCLECGSDSDCSYHGECEKKYKRCSCKPPWTGRSCQTNPCPLLIYNLTDQENVSVTAEFEHLEDITYNDRPVYYSETKSNSTELVVYSYGRFNVYEKKDFEKFQEDETLLKTLSYFLRDLHDFWDYYPESDSSLILKFVSEYTTATMPNCTSGIESTDVTWKNNWLTNGTTIEFKCDDSSKELDPGYNIGFKYHKVNG